VILANGWPSWLEILPAIGFQDIKVWCQDPDLLETFYADLFEDFILRELDDLAHISRFRQPMLFLSGSRSFIKRIKFNSGIYVSGLQFWWMILVEVGLRFQS
jgi:hypothetical protein